MTTTMPNVNAVKDLFADLLGRDVDLQVADPWAPGAGNGVFVAEFVDSGLRLRAIAMLDLPLGICVGASIGSMPANGAKDMIVECDPAPMVIDNLYEVLNVLTSVFNELDNAHVKIGTLHVPGNPLPGEVSLLTYRLGGRLDLCLEIDGYGTGRLALIDAD